MNDKQLLAAVKKRGKTAVAKELGIPRTTLYSRLERIERGGSAVAPKKFDDIVAGDVSEEEKLNQRLKELEKIARAQRKSEVFEDRIIDSLTKAVEAREPLYSPLVIPKSQRKIDKHEFVLLWSDLHAAERVSLDETNGINEYNWKIMLERHDRLREGLYSYQDNRPYPVEKLHVCGLGDMLSGNIHDELAETNEMPLSEATIQLGLDSSVWVESLLERFPSIHVAGVVGNHPRAHRKTRAKQAFDNADWTMYHTMRLALRKQKAIEFNIPKANQLPITVADRWRILLWHGDGVRSTMPGVPWGGVMRRVAALQNQYNGSGMPIDLFACGHFHTANVVESSAGRVAMNGSIKGLDEYTLKAFGSGSKPQQVLLTFHPKNGLTDVSFIDLERPEPRA
jgi:hypothetical protein